MTPIHPNLKQKIVSKYPDAARDLEEYENLLGSRFNTDLSKARDNQDESRIKELHGRLFCSVTPGVIEEDAVQEVLESIPPSEDYGPMTDREFIQRARDAGEESYVGNLTREQFLNGLTKTARDLPRLLLSEWESIDDELREEYVDQLQWMLNATTLKLHDLEAKLKLAENRLRDNNGGAG